MMESAMFLVTTAIGNVGRLWASGIRVDPIAAAAPGLYDMARILGLAIKNDKGGVSLP